MWPDADLHSAVLTIAVNHVTCDVYLPKAVEKWIHWQCYGYCFFLLCVKYIFFSFYSGVFFALDSKGIINVLKRYKVSHGILWHCSFHFRLLCKVISPEATVCLVFCIFFVILDKRSELSCCLIVATVEIGRKINYFQAKQRTCHNMQELRHR